MTGELLSTELSSSEVDVTPPTADGICVTKKGKCGLERTGGVDVAIQDR
jgi:hypothetical protein